MDPRDFFDEWDDITHEEESDDDQSLKSIFDVSDDDCFGTEVSSEEAPLVGIHVDPPPYRTDLDLVLIFDATESTIQIINKIKSIAANFKEHLEEKRIILKRHVYWGNVRIRVIICRDYYNSEKPMRASRFFDLNNDEDNQSFVDFINDIEAIRGKNEPEAALEALCEAIHSPWSACKPATKGRQMVVLFTDASANSSYMYKPLDLNCPGNSASKAPITVKNLTELHEHWIDSQIIHQGRKRLMMYTPDSYPWTEIESFDISIRTPITTLCHGDEVDIEPLLKYIIYSL